MIEWWTNLRSVNQVLYVLAAFFSLIFIWQFISSLIGLAGGEADVDVDADVDAGDIEAHSLEDASDTVAAFRILSIRAVLAFLMLLCWGGALYLNMGKELTIALLYGVGWGMVAFVAVTVLVNWLRRLAEAGNPRLETCVGTAGSVYLDVPPDGMGEARVKVSGVISMVKARSKSGREIKAGTPVRVVRLLDATTVEVDLIGPDEKGKETEK